MGWRNTILLDPESVCCKGVVYPDIGGLERICAALGIRFRGSTLS